MFTDNPSFIVLFTLNLEETKQFYLSLKAKIIEEEQNKIVIILGENELHFVNSKGVPDSNYQLEISAQNSLLIYIGTKNIKKTYTTILKLNPIYITPIKPNDWESKEFMFHDNNGYKFVCYEDLIDF